MNLLTREELYAKDPLLPDVLDFAVTQDALSITLIQRKFGIGYPRAARLMDAMVEEGFVENKDGPKKVLLSMKDYLNIYGKMPKQNEENEDKPSPKPIKGNVTLAELNLANIEFFDKSNKPVDEEMANELNQTLLDILFKDEMINLSGDFLLKFLNEKNYKVKYVVLDFEDVGKMAGIMKKVASPIIYIIDLAPNSVMEIFKKGKLLVKEGVVTMRKTNNKHSTLTVLY